METRDLGFALAACDGELRNGSAATTFARVNTDSRQAQAGDLFVALAGENFDGHDFVAAAAELGAAAVLVERDRSLPGGNPACAVIAVENTRRAYGQLGAAYRRDFQLPVIAVGGSNGKTSTKELMAAVLRTERQTLWSEASFNNEIGVPATLLRLERTHEVAVLEVGTNHPGELAALLKLVQPRHGVITNIGREHLEFFGDLAGVAREEGAVAESLPPDGKLFVNGDSEWAAELAARTAAGVVRVGFGAGCDWQAADVKLGKKGSSFTVRTARREFCGSYAINLLGEHQVGNSLFAIALGAELGLSPASVKAGLATCEPAKMRLQLYEVAGVRVLDDAYNANADSMLAALRVLRDLPCQGRRVAVLGDMAELGAHSESAHAEVGRQAAALGVEQLIAVGKMAGTMALAARNAGLNRVIELADAEVAAAAIRSFLKSGDTVLLKASRSSRLERIAAALKAVDGVKSN